MKLIMLYGAPGVGKYTTGRELEKLTGYPLFHNHLTVDLVATVFDFGTPPFQELRERIWLDVMQRAACEGLPGLIFTFVFEPTILPGFIDRLASVVQSDGGSFHPVRLDCETEENLRRVQAPDRARFLKTTDTALVRIGIDGGVYVPELPLPDEIQIDITQMPPAQTALRIAEALGLPRR